MNRYCLSACICTWSAHNFRHFTFNTISVQAKKWTLKVRISSCCFHSWILELHYQILQLLFAKLLSRTKRNICTKEVRLKTQTLSPAWSDSWHIATCPTNYQWQHDQDLLSCCIKTIFSIEKEWFSLMKTDHSFWHALKISIVCYEFLPYSVHVMLSS